MRGKQPQQAIKMFKIRTVLDPALDLGVGPGREDAPDAVGDGRGEQAPDDCPAVVEVLLLLGDGGDRGGGAGTWGGGGPGARRRLLGVRGCDDVPRDLPRALHPGDFCFSLP